MTRLGRRVEEADGFIVLTAAYNHGYPAVSKNAIDHTFVEWHRHRVPSSVDAMSGGARAIEQLRLVAVELEVAPLRHAVHILPDRMIAARDADDRTDPAILSSLDERLSLLVDDLLW